jgi:hypothetical protein
MGKSTVIATILGFLAAFLLTAHIPVATAASHSSITFDCMIDSISNLSGSVGDTIEVTLTSCSGESLASTTPGIVSWRSSTTTNPTSVTTDPFIMTVSLLSDGRGFLQIGSSSSVGLRLYVSSYGTFNCSVDGIENTSFTGNVGDTFSFHANGSCNLSVSDPGIVSWRDTSNSANPSSTVNSVVIITLIAEGTTTFTAQWPSYPSSGRQLNIAITSNAPIASTKTTDVGEIELLIYGESSAFNCTARISGQIGTWIQLTNNGCTATGKEANVTLLGWSTSPNFPVDIARKVIENRWGVYEIFSAGRIAAVFIPVNGYTQLTSENRIYPIWG